ncbi:pyruvate dehydrogenase (acetyl-transferring) E1 component subunit alpha [Amycolatopsis sp. K13G38]|uniref:Pyruvate dehydrogenase E1 component subunit alpha n=1 Tax=Amycolatopsis acididurans TaxID=2724524 RepID=A0ABX1IWF8_9PSEU|nr:pyruvate dehydrogenase (acetyl-transferring) E1 component subunit alpha [Amycolatopsis acididurans]
MLRQMTRIRRFEERCVELYSATAIRGFMHLYIGEEAVAAGVMQGIGPEDNVVSTYREHGHALARGIPMAAVMAEMYGRTTGCSHGRGGSMHLFDAGRRFYGGNAIVGGGLPVATGFALADAMRGRPLVTVCLFGDGAVSEGEFHESLNLAALWRLPLLFACENNLYAMGTALKRAQSETDLAVHAASYGVPSWPVDGMNALEVADAVDHAVEAIRAGAGPHFLELRTYRFRAHSMYDAERYRDKAEVRRWKERDPLPALAATLRAEDRVTAKDIAAVESEVDAEIDAAVAAAEQGPLEPPEELTRFVYSEQS